VEIKYNFHDIQREIKLYCDSVLNSSWKNAKLINKLYQRGKNGKGSQRRATGLPKPVGITGSNNPARKQSAPSPNAARKQSAPASSPRTESPEQRRATAKDGGSPRWR